MDDSFDLELAAASLRADSTDVRILVKVLADQLADALGPRLHGAAGRRPVPEVRRDPFAPDRPSTTTSSRPKSTATPRLHHRTLLGRHPDPQPEGRTWTTWLARLLAALKAEAAHSQSVRSALEDIVIGGKR